MKVDGFIFNHINHINRPACTRSLGCCNLSMCFESCSAIAMCLKAMVTCDSAAMEKVALAQEYKDNKIEPTSRRNDDSCDFHVISM